MIRSISIKNYRRLQSLDMTFERGLNILVGSNEAGKSTLLEAITLAMTGRVRGRWAQDELNPYWFNMEITERFFKSFALNPKTPIPEIQIELFLDSENPLLIQQLMGTNNAKRKDALGMRLQVRLDEAYLEEFLAYMGSEDVPRLLPTDYFQVSWTTFRAPDHIRRKPRGLSLAQVDDKTLASSGGVDYFTRQLIVEHIDPMDRAKLSTDMRVMRDQLGRKHLERINKQLKQADDSPHQLGVHLDQTANSSWDAAVGPQVDDIPFSMSGQAQQAFAKIELALLKNDNDEGIVLVEEPENHLSHTRLRQLVERLQRLARGRQLILSTHSSYVLNRLGLNSLRLIGLGSVAPLADMDPADVQYFRKLPNFETLRLILADKVLLVEGPSEQLIADKVCSQKFGKSTAELGIDVISIAGTPFKRWFELARLLKKPVVGIRDNDDKPKSYWEKKYDIVGDLSIQLFVGERADGHTLEPQIVTANNLDEAPLREALGLGDSEDLRSWMSKNKTDAALSLATTPVDIVYPRYFVDAIEAAANG